LKYLAKSQTSCSIVNVRLIEVYIRIGYPPRKNYLRKIFMILLRPQSKHVGKVQIKHYRLFSLVVSRKGVPFVKPLVVIGISDASIAHVP